MAEVGSPLAASNGSTNRGLRPGRLQLWWNRAPVVLYRLGLGWIFGHVLLLITHHGRKSGRVYHTVVQVVRYDPQAEESIVLSGWGGGSDWYLNLRADSALEVQTGGCRFVPDQRILMQQEIEAELALYERQHPQNVRIIGKRLGVAMDGSESARRALAAVLPMVGFRPRRALG